jgi:outer membrane PBP1 activator LpoA protein
MYRPIHIAPRALPGPNSALGRAHAGVDQRFLRRRIARNALAALAVCLVAACKMAGMPTLGADAAERADRLARQGDHAGAAQSYEAAAKGAREGAGNALWLAAAREWLLGGEIAAAEAALARLQPPLAAADVREQRRLDAEIALARGDTARAAEILRGIEGEDAATLATRARVQFGSLRVADAVTSLMARERLLTGAAERQANQRMIVDGIQSALLRGADARPPAGAGPELSGWLELGRILADARSGALGTQRRLQSWRDRYPGHPAGDALWKGIAERPSAAGDRPRQVALLLPLSGRAAAAGGAVRDGFLGAYYDDGSPERPKLRIYDVAERDAPSAYLQALADGCDFVVGPLTREEVASLATLADGRATTLALNFLPDNVQVPDRFYQYALSPEDEARLAARRIAADGRLSGVTLAPQSDWGRRVQAAFAEEFAAAGGQVVDQADYVPSTADFNDILRQLLRTTGQRGSLPRPDAQFIFVAAQPVHGRLIRTQLRFNYASALPMYATSDVYDPAGPGNVDLDGVIFPDMPWVLDPQGADATARDAAERVFPGRSGQLARLYAFGYDAFRLVGELPRMRDGRTGPLPGATGRLVVDAHGRVRRELEWAQIVGGRAAPWPALAAPIS